LDSPAIAGLSISRLDPEQKWVPVIKSSHTNSVECFKEILHYKKANTENFYLGLDISKEAIDVFDCMDFLPENILSMDEAQKKLKDNLDLIVTAVPKAIIVIIGGSSDLALPALSSMKGPSLDIIHVDGSLPVSEPHMGNEHHQSVYRQIYSGAVG